jgi:uncharacterized protein (DUF433 family)
MGPPALRAMTTQTDLGWAGCSAVERDPQRVSDAWVFRGTRIPVAALFENLEDGVSLAEFVELFPYPFRGRDTAAQHSIPDRSSPSDHRYQHRGQPSQGSGNSDGITPPR